jgi:benzoylformate decarboxylase
MTMMMGSQAVVELLRKEGVEYVFGIPGATEVLFMDALEDHAEIKYILGLQEVVIMGMAEGYARMSGKAGVVNLHTGPGVAAAMPMLFNAHMGGVPLVVTAGQQDSRLLMQEPALSGDLVKMASQLTKWSTEVSHASDIPVAMRRAFKVAMHPPTGPGFVSLPQDILGQEIDFEDVPRAQYFSRLRPDREAIQRASESLAAARTPALVLGNGVAKSGAVPEVVKLAELLGARVYHPWMSEVNFPVGHPQYLGDLDLASLRTREILESVDVLVVIGIPLFRPSAYLPKPLITANTKVIQIDNDGWEIAKNIPVAVGVEGDIKAAVAELNEVLQERLSAQAREGAKIRAKEISKEKERMTDAFLQKALKERDHVPISASRLMQELRDALKPDSLVVDDSWSCSQTLYRSIDFIEPKSFQRAPGGSIGWGMPGSLGVKLAAGDRPVVAVVGDGSAAWSIQSLWTASHYNIPVTYIICANASYSQVKIMKMRLMGEKAKGRNLGTSLDNPRMDFCQLAQAMGVYGQKAERPEDLKEALKTALGSGKPALVEVYIESI